MSATERYSLFSDALRRIIPEGEERSYGYVTDTMRAWGYDTAGIGMWLEQFKFRGRSDGWRGSEFVTYRVPYFDYEQEGDWTEGTLMIVRRGAETE